MASTDDTIVNSVITDPLVPITSDKEPIKWDGNFATILANIFETSAYHQRRGLFQPFVLNNAALQSNGRLAVDSLESVLFVTNTIVDTTTYSVDEFAPHGVFRLQRYNATSGMTAVVAPTELR